MWSFPHMRIDKKSSNLYWKRQQLTRICSWSDFPTVSNEVVVLATGPSVSRQISQIADTNFIDNRSIVLVNGAISLLVSGDIKACEAVIVEDGRFILERYELLSAIAQKLNLVLSVSALHALCFVSPEIVKKHNIWLMDSVLYPYGRPQRAIHSVKSDELRVFGNAGLSLDLNQGHFGCGTVMYAGVQLGFHVGASKIGLVGVDLTNYDEPRFYEQQGDQAWSGVDNSYKTRILPSLELAAAVAKEKGVELVNYSPTSIIPRVLIPFEEL